MAKQKFTLRIIAEQFDLPNGIKLQLRTHAHPHRNRLGKEIGAIEDTAICTVCLVVPEWDKFLWPALFSVDESDGPAELAVIGETLAALGCSNAAVVQGFTGAIQRQLADIIANPAA